MESQEGILLNEPDLSLEYVVKNSLNFNLQENLENQLEEITNLKDEALKIEQELIETPKGHYPMSFSYLFDSI